MSEPTNEQRAALAAVAMKAFEPNLPVKMQDETTLIDLLTDLRHWCDRNEVDFDAECRVSKESMMCVNSNSSLLGIQMVPWGRKTDTIFKLHFPTIFSGVCMFN